MVPAATSKRQPRLYIKQQAWLCSGKMSLRKTGIGLVWSAGCSLLTPGLDRTPCFTDEENRVGSSRPGHTLKSRAPEREREVSPTAFRADMLTLCFTSGKGHPEKKWHWGHCCPSTVQPWAPWRWARRGVSPYSSLQAAGSQCRLLPQRVAPGRPVTVDSPAWGRLPLPRPSACTPLFQQFWEWLIKWRCPHTCDKGKPLFKGLEYKTDIY